MKRPVLVAKIKFELREVKAETEDEAIEKVRQKLPISKHNELFLAKAYADGIVVNSLEELDLKSELFASRSYWEEV